MEKYVKEKNPAANMELDKTILQVCHTLRVGSKRRCQFSSSDRRVGMCLVEIRVKSYAKAPTQLQPGTNVCIQN